MTFTLLKLLRKVPVAGTILWLANSYSYGGDARSAVKFAPLKLWFKSFFWNFFAATLLTLLTLPDLAISVWYHFKRCQPIAEKLSGFGASPGPGATILSVFPNLLGLGIGIYALLFALDSAFVRQMHQKLEKAKRAGERKHGSVLILNSDIAFPLAAMVVIVALGAIAQAFPEVMWIQVLTWAVFWYGLVLVLEIIALLFLLVDNSLLEKAGDNAPNGSRTEEPPQ